MAILKYEDHELIADRIRHEQDVHRQSFDRVMQEIADDEDKARNELRRCEIRRQIVKATHAGRHE